MCVTVWSHLRQFSRPAAPALLLVFNPSVSQSTNLESWINEQTAVYTANFEVKKYLHLPLQNLVQGVMSLA